MSKGLVQGRSWKKIIGGAEIFEINVGHQLVANRKIVEVEKL